MRYFTSMITKQFIYHFRGSGYRKKLLYGNAGFGLGTTGTHWSTTSHTNRPHKPTKKSAENFWFCFLYSAVPCKWQFTFGKDHTSAAWSDEQRHFRKGNQRHLKRKKQKILLLLDGYDEYTKGTNKDIDAAIEDTIGDCFLILTSRDGDYISRETRNKLDGEIEITGFDEHQGRRYASCYFGNKKTATKMYKKANVAQLEGLLRLPIILLMVVALWVNKLNVECWTCCTGFEWNKHRCTYVHLKNLFW